MHEAEGDVRVITIDDHRHEQAIQRVPRGRVRGERGKCRMYSRPMLGNIAAVQSEALLTDPDGCVRIHGLEGALRAVRVLAQLTVEIVVNAQYQSSRLADSGV